MTEKKQVLEQQNPTMDELEKWYWEGSCYTPCIHNSWVEPDGHCPECGVPSWLIVLGFI